MQTDILPSYGAMDRHERALVDKQTPRLDENGREIVRVATCGTCGRQWNDAAGSSLTPTPAGRCPFEYEHEPQADEPPHPNQEGCCGECRRPPADEPARERLCDLASIENDADSGDGLTWRQLRRVVDGALNGEVGSDWALSRVHDYLAAHRPSS